MKENGVGALGSAILGTRKGQMAMKLFNVAKMRAYRAIVMAVGKGLKEGINNLYQWSKASHGAFATSMDTAASKLMLMKNSLTVHSYLLLLSRV
jgi:hypothetical protein